MELNLGYWRKTEEISWYFHMGELMKEVNAFLGCDITFSTTSELVLSPHANSSE
jgi:hypothetical protein